MKILSAKFMRDLSAMHQWKMVDKIVRTQLPEDMMARWESEGYEGLFSSVPEYFGMSRMYRCEGDHVTYEFTDEEWLMFCLKWL